MNQEPELSPQEKHKIWMKNSGYLYDRLLVHKMKWPSLTFQWLPTFKQNEKSVSFEAIVATHTSGQRQTQFIYILQIQFPNQKDLSDPDPSMPPISVKKIEEFRHQIEANRVRYWEKNPEFLAARMDNAPLAIFRRSNQYPQAILQAHCFGSGFALQWSENGLISADHEGNILIWADVEQKPEKYNYQKEIQDTKFIQKNIFTTVGSDGYLSIWDIRTGRIENKVPVSSQGVNSISINPVNRNLILTAGQDSDIKLWDARSYSTNLYKFQGHENSVLNVQWSPKTPTIFASGGQDSKVKIWDLLRVGFEIPKDNSGTDQLLFTHEGHQNDVLDLGWNPYCMLLGSTEQTNNTLQVYEISNCIQDLQFAEDMDYLREQCLS